MEIDVKYCPGTLKEGFSTYSRSCLKEMFDGKTVNHILNFPSPGTETDEGEKIMDFRKGISISGVQEKYSMKLVKKELVFTDTGGEYILKPIPRDLRKVSQVPANEHLTMQIAKQIFKIPVAANALIFFNDGKPAYLTRRFDVLQNGRKRQEDFACLAMLTEENAGKNYKYDYSYEGMAKLLKKYVTAYAIEVERFFRLVIFNYLISNGDAHLRNFSLTETTDGDFVLTPAYDLVCTRIHVDDTGLALAGGLFENDFNTESFKANGFYAYDDFYEFGKRIEISDERVVKIIQSFLNKDALVREMVNRSFLTEETKESYFANFLERQKALKYSFLNNKRGRNVDY